MKLELVSRQRHALQAPDRKFLIDMSSFQSLLRQSSDARQKMLSVLQQLQFLKEKEELQMQQQLQQQIMYRQQALSNIHVPVDLR